MAPWRCEQEAGARDVPLGASGHLRVEAGLIARRRGPISVGGGVLVALGAVNRSSICLEPFVLLAPVRS